MGATFFYLYILFSLFDWRKGPNIVHLAIWVLSLSGELILFTTTAVVAANCHFVRAAEQDDDQTKHDSCIDSWTKLDLVLYFVRLLTIGASISLFCVAWVLKSHVPDRVEEGLGGISETTPLLLNGQNRSYDTRQSTTPEANGRRSRGRTISNAAKPTGGLSLAKMNKLPSIDKRRSLTRPGGNTSEATLCSSPISGPKTLPSCSFR